jgi:hypothetical protein
MSPRLSIHLLVRDKSSSYGFDPLQVPYAGGMRNALRSIARSESGALINLTGLEPAVLLFFSTTVNSKNLSAPTSRHFVSPMHPEPGKFLSLERGLPRSTFPLDW